MPRAGYWGLFELFGCKACSIPPLPQPASFLHSALPPSLVLRLLIPHRAEAAVFCLLLLPVEHRYHLRGGGPGRACGELPGLVQVLWIVGIFLVFVGTGTLHLWPPPCSVSSAHPSHPHTPSAPLKNSDARHQHGRSHQWLNHHGHPFRCTL